MRRLALALPFAALSLAMPDLAQAQSSQIRVGALECDISAGIGVLIGSRREITCRFEPTRGGRPEIYVGEIMRFGLDVGVTGPGRLVWAVFAPTNRLAPGQLAGTYAGVGAEASVAVGLGANALVGGSRNTVALQPLSIQGQTGVNLAIGVAEITLRRAR